MEKILIIRLSSFGDIVQTTACIDKIKQAFPSSKLDWLVRSEFKELLSGNPALNQIFCMDKGSKFSSLWAMYKRLKKENYTHIYDAHNNTRSNLLLLLLFPQILLQRIKVIQRPKNRFLRFLLFRFGINRFPWPFVLVRSYLEPLKAWGIDKSLPKESSLKLSSVHTDSLEQKYPLLKDSPFLCLAPSAAWELKRWPKENWQSLIDLWADQNIVLLGGKEDLFIEEFLEMAKPRKGFLLNLAGKLSLAESCACISKAQWIVGGDSGLTHVADSLRKNTFCIIGAAAFAYPAYPNTYILDHKLPCKPCSKDGRGRCKNQEYKACLYGISPQYIYKQWQQSLELSR